MTGNVHSSAYYVKMPGIFEATGADVLTRGACYRQEPSFKANLLLALLGSRLPIGTCLVETRAGLRLSGLILVSRKARQTAKSRGPDSKLAL